MSEEHDETELMRAVALRNANSVLAARQRAQQELMETKDALRHANTRMENMLESLTDGFCAVDRGWRITYINARALQLLSARGKTREALLGRVIWDEFPELRTSAMEEQFRGAMDSQQTTSFEFFYPSLGSWFDLRAYPSDGGLTVYFQDISKRKADEQALLDGSSRLQVALSAGRLGDWRWDAGADRVTLGARAAEIFGLPAETPLPWGSLRERLHDGDKDMARTEFLQAFAQHTDLNIECRVDRPDGDQCWIGVVGRADYDRDGAVLGMTGVVQDISTRKSAEDTLRESEEVLRALANSIPQLAWMAQADGAIVWFNKRWYEYTGTTPDQMVGWGWQSTHDPDVLPQMLVRWHESIRTGNPFEMEFPIRGADGQYRWFLTRVNAVRDRLGHVVRWFGTNTDVDQVKRVQQALRDESNVLELLNSTGSALASQRDLRSLLQTVTDAATGISGARFGAFFYHGKDGDGDLFTLHTVAGVAPPEFETDGELRTSALFGPNLRSVSVLRSDDIGADPRYAPLHAHGAAPDDQIGVRSYLAVPVIARSGEVLGSLFFSHPETGIFSERTERIVGGIAAQAAVAIDNTRLYEAAQHAAEERKVLLESERSARAEAERTSQMKDEFLATLSHELRTPLSAILGWAQVLRRGSRDQADLQRGLQTIERNARAQAQLIEDLLDMSRITSGKVLLDMQTVAPAGFIDAAIETVRPAADAKNIRIEKFYAPGVGMIAGDPARLQQVIWNLLSNAIKFTARDGMVCIALRNVDGHVEIAVNDTGVGIKPEFMAHVFERFRQGDASTTRKHGGLGLGLSIVKHLIEQHGGTVRADSPGEGHGATFTIELPAANRQSQASRAGRPPSLQMAPLTPEILLRDLSHLNVLVVDDEPDARDLIRRILSDCNATVRTAASAADALAEFRTAPPDVLVSDLGMPDVDGFELLAQVRALGHAGGGDVPAVALTAFARSEDRLRALEAGFMAHIAKPVEPSELIATVASMGESRPR
ncbi:hybrid sensor histidine kinase/response regulator [Massilia pseudoviolaceinigra]|uniref:hybrid sensor histidine kinase/response regulator n=1 Tax=Massilia pseudoviolaceinigra TaxID=3057165 RepID=UPI0027967BC4|nr:ATP-binding protein [Massilia sp. CCM 9206]MDQ1922503.1 PAS domain S-box protein [Massilia sp. CCM 9206]